MWSNIFRSAAAHPLLNSVLLFVLSLPLIASWGQFLATGYLAETIAVHLLFWPKADWKLSVPLPGLLIFGCFSLLYIMAIVSLWRKRRLGEAFLFVLAGFTVAKLSGAAFRAITGWSLPEQMNIAAMTGKINTLVFATWHNPLWEELVFRGLPLLFLALAYRRTPLPAAGKWFYILLPSTVFAIYHIPGHGVGTLLESFLIGVMWAFTSLRWGLLAPILLHIFSDAIIVLSLAQIKNIPKAEIPWLVQHGWLLNTTWFLSVLVLLLLIPALLLWEWRKSRRPALPSYK